MSPTPPRADIYETRFQSWLAESVMAALPDIRLQPTAAGAMTWSVIAFPVSPAHQRLEASNYPLCVSPGTIALDATRRTVGFSLAPDAVPGS